MSKWPINILYGRAGIVAVTPEVDGYYYRDVPRMTYEDMVLWIEKNRGYIMQQDDPWLPPFTLIERKEDAEQ